MATATSAQTTYVATDVGTFGGPLTSATGVNSAGDVVGWSDTPNVGRRAFLWRNGTMSDLGTLPGRYSSLAYGINDSGMVVGISDFDPFAYIPGSGMVWLGALHGPLAFDDARAINQTGQIAGNGRDLNTPSNGPAMIYYNGTPRTLPSLAGSNFSLAQAINDSEQAAGYAVFGFNRHASRWSGFIYGNVTDLGIFPGGSYSEATGINSSGQIVGYGDTPSSSAHAFLYSAGIMTDLGTLVGGPQDSHAYGINTAGQVVGSSWAYRGGTGETHAIIYTTGGGMVDLNLVTTNLAGFRTLDVANAINATGQIAGAGIFSDGTSHAFLLTPTTPHSAFFNGETALGGGWYYLQFPNGTPFGYYSYLSEQNFIYHIDLGFEYLFDANDANHGIYVYDFASSSFFYTSPSTFPYLYDFSLNAWLYYLPDVNNPGRYTHNPRWFYNFATGQWITL